MQISFKNLKGKPVILVDGKFLGSIYDMLFSGNDILVFQVQRSTLLGIISNIYVLKEDVESVNNDLLIVLRFALHIERNGLIRSDEVLSKEVIDEHGNLIGIVADILFDSEDFRITGFEVVESIWGYIKNKKIILSPEEIILKENKILS